MNRLRYIGILIVLVSLLGCQKGELTVADYRGWVQNPDNGLKVMKELKDYRFELFYKPVEFVAINEQKTNDIDTTIYFNRVRALSDLQYYTLKIASLTGQEMMRTGISNEQEYSSRLQYFSDLAQYDMRLVDGADTLTCALFHFERNYGVAPYNNIVLAFTKPISEIASKTLVFDDRVLGVGKVNLKITENAIKRIPKIRLN